MNEALQEVQVLNALYAIGMQVDAERVQLEGYVLQRLDATVDHAQVDWICGTGRIGIQHGFLTQHLPLIKLQFFIFTILKKRNKPKYANSVFTLLQFVNLK